MFWIHGGYYSTGSSNEQAGYDGHNLSENGDVVVVSINHRLNCLGFLDLSAYGETYRYSGNAGLLDIIAALQWVQDNIAHFGGDPGNVTVFGQSGGASKVMNLLAMPMAEGLFHKCILQSGFNTSMTPADAQVVTKLVFKELGIAEGDIAALSAVEYEKLRTVGDIAIKKASEQTGRALQWCPVVDNDSQLVNAWDAEIFPVYGGNIPMIIGNCLAEMSSNTVDMAGGKDWQKNSWDDETVNQKLADKYGDKKDAVVEAFKKAYPDKKIADVLYYDTMFRGSAKTVLPARAEAAAPVYNYMFAYEAPNMGGLMSFHCADIPFVFGNVSKHALANGAGEEGHKLESIMLGAWSAFAHTGDPNHSGMIDWPAYTNENGATMIFEKECRIGYHHDDELMALLLG